MNFGRALSAICFVGTVFLTSPGFAGPTAAIIKVKGDVENRKDQNAQWSASQKGTFLAPKHQVKTGEEGLAMVKLLADKSLIRMKSKSLLTVGAGKEGKGKNYKVGLGAVFFNIKKRIRKKGLSVETPTSVATVKGTRFWIIVDENGNSTLVVTEGEMNFAIPQTGQKTTVLAGQTAYSDGQKIQIRKTGASDLPPGEKSETLNIQFRDKDGNPKQLEIEFEELK